MVLPAVTTFSTRSILLSNSAGAGSRILHHDGDRLAGRRMNLGRLKAVILERKVYSHRIFGLSRRHNDKQTERGKAEYC